MNKWEDTGWMRVPKKLSPKYRLVAINAETLLVEGKFESIPDAANFAGRTPNAVTSAARSMRKCGDYYWTLLPAEALDKDYPSCQRKIKMAFAISNCTILNLSYDQVNQIDSIINRNGKR